MLWLLVIATVTAGTHALARHWLERPVVKLALLPGVVVSAVSHALACWLSRTPIEGIHLWRRGPVLTWGKPGLAGRLLLGLLPFAAALAAVLAIHAALAPPLEVSIDLPELEPSARHLGRVVAVWREVVVSVPQSLRELQEPLDPRLLAFVWCAGSILLYGAPRLEQWKILAAVLVGGWIVLATLDQWGIGARFLSRAWFARLLYGDEVWEAIALLVATTTLVVSALAALSLGLSVVRALLLPRRSSGRS